MKMKLGSKYVLPILLIILTLLAGVFLYSFKAQLNAGWSISCGGQGGSANAIIQAEKGIVMDNTIWDIQGGKGGDCNIFIENESKLRFYEMISLIGLIISLVADSIFIYDRFIRK